jgi:hypothetical protein
MSRKGPVPSQMLPAVMVCTGCLYHRPDAKAALKSRTHRCVAKVDKTKVIGYGTPLTPDWCPYLEPKKEVDTTQGSMVL